MCGVDEWRGKGLALKVVLRVIAQGFGHLSCIRDLKWNFAWLWC